MNVKRRNSQFGDDARANSELIHAHQKRPKSRAHLRGRRSVIGSMLLSAVLGSTYAATKKIDLLLHENSDANGHPAPIDEVDIAIIRLFERESGLSFEPKILPWKRAQQVALQQGGMLYGFSKNLERLRLYDFSLPISEINIWAVTDSSSALKIREPADLTGLRLSVDRGTSLGVEFDVASKKYNYIIEEDPPSTEIRFRKLINKRCDVLLLPMLKSDRPIDASHFINQVKIVSYKHSQLYREKFIVSEKALFLDSEHFAVAKGRYTNEMNAINTALKANANNPYLKKLIEEYWDYPQS